MEPYIDREIEEMLVQTGKNLRPDPTRLQSIIDDGPKVRRTDSPLSPISFMFIMNTASKVLLTLVAVVVVGGAGMYMSQSSSMPSPENSGAVLPVPETGEVSSGSEQLFESGSPSFALADSVTASLQSSLDAQSASLASLDQSARQTVTTVDTANSSKQPYDENAI